MIKFGLYLCCSVGLIVKGSGAHVTFGTRSNVSDEVGNDLRKKELELNERKGSDIFKAYSLYFVDAAIGTHGTYSIKDVKIKPEYVDEAVKPTKFNEKEFRAISFIRILIARMRQLNEAGDGMEHIRNAKTGMMKQGGEGNVGRAIAQNIRSLCVMGIDLLIFLDFLSRDTIARKMFKIPPKFEERLKTARRPDDQDVLATIMSTLYGGGFQVGSNHFLSSPTHTLHSWFNIVVPELNDKGQAYPQGNFTDSFKQYKMKDTTIFERTLLYYPQVEGHKIPNDQKVEKFTLTEMLAEIIKITFSTPETHKKILNYFYYHIKENFWLIVPTDKAKDVTLALKISAKSWFSLFNTRDPKLRTYYTFETPTRQRTDIVSGESSESSYQKHFKKKVLLPLMQAAANAAAATGAES